VMPKEPTFAGVNAYSCKFWPVRCKIIVVHVHSGQIRDGNRGGRTGRSIRTLVAVTI